MAVRQIWFCFAMMMAPYAGEGQWLHQRDPATPRTAGGKPDLSKPAPRANGRPDLSGVWQAEGSPIPDLMRLLPGAANGLGEDIPSKYFISVLADFNPGTEPLRSTVSRPPDAIRNFRNDDPGFKCLPRGMPLLDLQPAPFKIVQTPRVLMMLYETDTTFRQIFTDGRTLPQDRQPTWMGYSVGHWEGESLIVDTVGLNDRGWLDASGHTHTDSLRINERFTRRDFGHIDVRMTLDDPKTFTRPITFQFRLGLLPDTDLIENYCSENETDLAHVGR